MKQLFWKEWYELRQLPLMSAVCVVMLVFGAKVYNDIQIAAQRFQMEDTCQLLVWTWIFSALVAGAGLFAPEVGSGGLLFLSALPTSRRRLWWVKVTTAFGMLLLTMICSMVTWSAVDAMMFRVTFFTPLYTALHQWAFIQEDWGVLLIPLGFFAVALAISPFFDRSISTVFAALLVSFADIVALQNFASEYVNYNGIVYEGIRNSPHARSWDGLFLILVSLSLPVFLVVSYWTFTKGETLRSRKRFRVGAVSGAASFGIATLVFGAGSYLHWW